MKFMQFAVLNFSWAGLEYPLILEASPWSVRIDPVPNIAALKRTLETDRGYATTHQGTVERLDGNLFPVEEATDLLYGLDDFLSFVCGSFCSLTNVIGIDSGGNEAWKRWGSHHVSPWRRHRSWLDITISGALPDIFSSFWCEYKKNKKSLSRVLKLYALSNKTGSVDVSVILTQAALELLSYLTVGKKKERKTGDWIADGLQKAGIDPQIPSDFGELEKLRQREECKHGPHTIVKMRNSMTHSEFLIGDISIDVYYQAMNLGLWYLELLLLRMFEHTGKYASRLTPVQRAGYTELVPWAQGGGV